MDGVRFLVAEHGAPEPEGAARAVFVGDIGFGEAFMDDEWDSDDLTAVVRFFIRNRDTVNDGRFRSTLVQKGIEGLRFLAQRNTLPGSRRNIRRHYDLSNEFFQTFLGIIAIEHRLSPYPPTSGVKRKKVTWLSTCIGISASKLSTCTSSTKT